jgi:hypothetical protein
MKKEKLFKVRYRWHTGSTYDTQVVNDETLKKMETSNKFVITGIKEY